ncbi:uL15 family ribosomal protein [Candidatus Woesearchaeota archaeon]|nr:uL15 family ribosomal protein [Candidatus Woesearchaeota archaeon]
MAVNKRKKNTRQRGYTTHGYGSMKKHRGAGNRGGRGHSGSGKRGDQNKPSFWKNKKYFGKFGFTSKSRATPSVTINIKTIEDKLETLLKTGLAKREGDSFAIDLADLGYNKLLSTGTPTKKLKITTRFAVAKAVEKIQNAGGEVTVLESKERAEKAAEEAQDEPAEQEAE